MSRLRRPGLDRGLAVALAALLPPLPAPAAAQAVDPVRHEPVIRSVRTEGGAVLPEARVGYGA